MKRARQILQSFADDTRLRIINLLHKKELTVSQIRAIVRHRQPNLSKHLARLRLTGIVGDRREGSNVYYYLIRSDNRIHRALLSAVTTGLADIETFKKDGEALHTLKKRRRQCTPKK